MTSFKKKVFLLFSFFIFTFTFLYSGSWFICMGSFSNYENSKKRCEELDALGVKTFVGETDSGMYRVFFEKKYDTRAEAKESLIKEFSSVKVDSFWVTEYSGDKTYFVINNTASKVVVEVPVEVIKEVIVEKPVEVIKEVIVEKPVEVIKEVIVEKPVEVIKEVIVEKTVEKIVYRDREIQAPVKLEVSVPDEIPVNEEKPYSVKIAQFKERESAEQNQERLKENEIDSYIINQFDEKTHFNFNLHTGAFESQEEAEKRLEELKTEGIVNASLSDFKEIKDQVEKYNEVVSSEEIIKDFGKEEIPNILSDYVRTALENIPYDENYQLEDMFLYDLDNLKIDGRINEMDTIDLQFKIAGEEFEKQTKEFSIYTEISALHTFAYVLYKDLVYEGNIRILFGVNNLENYDNESLEYLKIRDNLYFGKTPKNELISLIEFNNVSEKDMTDFMQNINEKQNICRNQHVQKTLFVAPDNSAEINRDFLFYSSRITPEEYIEWKHYESWSYGYVGYRRANIYFIENKNKINISMFDMVYDYNAKKQNDLKRGYTSTFPLKDSNASILSVTETLTGKSGLELGFTKNANVIVCQSENHSRNDLIKLAEDLKIWDEE